MKPDYLTRDYAQEGLDAMREAGRRVAEASNERFVRDFLRQPHPEE